MKPPAVGSSRGGRSRVPLSSIAAALITCAVVLSLYTAFRPTATGAPGWSRRIVMTTGEGEVARGGGSSAQPCSKCPKCPVVAPAKPAAPVAPARVVLSSSAQLNMHNSRRYHVVTTCQGFSNHWQARIHYYWFKKQRELCYIQGECDMGGFTRILHSGEADGLMDEIPTVVVDPLGKEMSSKTAGYVVLNRPYAFMQWLAKTSIPEKYILMGEADHLFMRPMPNFMAGEAQGAAHFTYIVPTQYPNIVRKFVGPVSDEELKLVPQIGNSPTLVSIKQFRELAPMWYNTTMAIFDDKEAHDAWNWVLEMYGYSLAVFKLGQHKGMRVVDQMLAHPPFDSKELAYNGEPFYILHLTYPIRFNKTGGVTDKEEDTVWKFDKRVWGDHPPERNLKPPPENVDHYLTRLIISMMNDATANIPCWDEYVKTKRVHYTC